MGRKERDLERMWEQKIVINYFI